MRKLIIIISFLAAAIAAISCKTERQLQIQKGIPEVYNGHIKFVPVTQWEKMGQLPDTLIRIKNATIRKEND